MGVPAAAFAGDSASQTVSIAVGAIGEIRIGAARRLTVAIPAHARPHTVVAATTYAITTNGDNKKITAVLDSPMPPGVVLKANAAAPAGGTSLGEATLSAAPADLVTGVSRVAQSGLALTLKLSATVEAGKPAPITRSLTLAIVGAS